LSEGGQEVNEQKRALKRMKEYVSPDWAQVPDAQMVGRQGLRMEAALRMVLLYHSGQVWDDKARLEWEILQSIAGMEERFEEATSRTLCYAIRHVLGEQQL
jgi:hypothetical protein